MANTTLINGRAYDWSMIEFQFSNIVGEPIMGIQAIKWNRSRKIEMNYGVGAHPQSRGFGNITPTASISLDYNAQVTLQRLSPDGTLEGLGEFDLIIAYNHPEDGKTITTALRRCIFSEDGLDANQDDTNLVSEIPLNPGAIEPIDASSIL